MHQCGDTVLGSVSGSLCGREDQKQASVFPLRVALFLHDDAEGKQRCTTGKEGARKSAGVFLCLPVSNEGTGSAAGCYELWWKIGL